MGSNRIWNRNYLITDTRQKHFQVESDASPLNASILDVNLPLQGIDIKNLTQVIRCSLVAASEKKEPRGYYYF